MYRFKKFKKAYGPGLHFIPDAFTYKKMRLIEGMRVGIISNQEIEVEDLSVKVNYLETPLVGSSGFIIGFFNNIPRVSQKEPLGKSKDKAGDHQPKQNVNLVERVLMFFIGAMPLIEGYNTFVTGYTVFAGKHGRSGFRIEGDWAKLWAVVLIMVGLLICGLALGLIKRRSKD